MAVINGQIVSDYPGGPYSNLTGQIVSDFPTPEMAVGEGPAFSMAGLNPSGSTAPIPQAQTFQGMEQDPHFMELFQYLKQGRGIPQASFDRLNERYGGNVDVAAALGIDQSRIIPHGSSIEAYDSTSYGPSYMPQMEPGASLAETNAAERAGNMAFAQSMGSQLGQSLQGVDNQAFLNDLSYAARYGMGSMPGGNYDPTQHSVDYRAPEATQQGITNFLSGGGQLGYVNYGTPFTPQQTFADQNAQGGLGGLGGNTQQPQQQQPNNGFAQMQDMFNNWQNQFQQNQQAQWDSMYDNLNQWGQMAYNGAGQANNGFQSGQPTNVSPVYNPNSGGGQPRNGWGGPLGNNNPWSPTF